MSSLEVGPGHAKRRVAWLALGVAVFGACAVGRGEGEVFGVVEVADCKSIDDYELRPSFFAAEVVESLLEIRVQRGSGQPTVSDGVYLLVRDAHQLQQELLGQDLTVDNADGPVGATLYLNKTCPPQRSRLPVTLPATGGTIRFHAIYSPDGEPTDVEIDAELIDVTFQDPRDTERRASLSGFFRFLYQRGRPAQLFP